uniref:RH2 domain-containing protein n=1 Tax=Timema poppense TaxID=170557 RepID=A0A7R9CU94_TIMPO|nr:unnamed protein product [Timema poppensis]
MSESPDLTNKAVFDLDDPNRPRFTTSELKEILHERNELKARVSDLEDELEIYRPKPIDNINAAAERSSCVNKECLAENLHEGSLIAQHVTHDAVKVTGDLQNMTISKKMIHVEECIRNKERCA